MTTVVIPHTWSDPVRVEAPALGGRLWLCLLCVLALWPSGAFAHPDVDRALASYDDGRFAESLSALDSALASHELTRDELVVVYRQRVLLDFAMRKREALSADARVLLSIDHEVLLGDAAPPDLTQRFDALRREVEPVHAEVRLENLPGGVRVALDTSQLQRPFRTEIAMRSAGSPWQRTDGTELRYPASPGAVIEYYAVVLGPSDVIVAGEGSPSAPKQHVTPQDKPLVSIEPVRAEPTQSVRDLPPPIDTKPQASRKWWWIGAGSAAAVATAVVVTLFATRDDNSSKSTVSSTTVTFP